MPEFPYIQSNYAQTIGSVPASTAGTTITSGGSTTTKGTYVELIAATVRDANWILIHLTNNSSTGSSHNIDIAIGSATEQVIIPDLQCIAKARSGVAPYLFPIFIPAGSRITARLAAPSSNTIEIAITLFSGTNISTGGQPSAAVCYGATGASIGTNVDPGGSANTDSAWTQITASTTRAHNWLVIGGNLGDGNLAATTKWLIDIGIGSATESEIVGDLLAGSGSANHVAANFPMCFPYFVPAASRLSVRLRSNVTTDGDRDIDIRIWGV